MIEETTPDIENQAPELEILYQDQYLVAVNKPAGMLVHRSWMDKGETVFLMQTLRNQIGQHVYPLHRLDKPTSGVILFALSSEIANQMQQQFIEHSIEKIYYAIVRGWIQQSDTLDYPLKKEQDKIADKNATQPAPIQDAITYYEPVARIEVPYACGRYPTSRYTLVKMLPKTGRKHQLRRHMHHLNHHMIGDVSHGDGKHNRLFREKFGCHRLLLHSYSLRFIHPITQQQLVASAPFDDTWLSVLSQLGIAEKF